MSKSTIPSLFALLLCFALVGCRPQPLGRIVFASLRDSPIHSYHEIYVVYTDGSGLTRLTHNEADDIDPAWSPDGRQIAFSSNRDGYHKLYLMDADGSNVIQLTSDELHEGEVRVDREPAWSPDGRHIAFTSNHDIFMIALDGTGVLRLTQDRTNEAPAWSPDGRRLAFVSNRDGGKALYVMNADGSSPVKLLERHSPTDSLDALGNPVTSVDDSDPAWSPDGSLIVFSSTAGDGVPNPPVWSLSMISADGSGVRSVLNRSTNDRQPAWSPDGRRIVYVCGSDLCITRPDGSDLVRLTDDPPPDVHPDWSP